MRAAAAAIVLLWVSPAFAQSGESTPPADPLPAESDTAEPQDDDDHSLVEEDVQPSVPVVTTGDVEVRVGGLVQVHAAPYVGDDALIENGDPATREGFRLRRARLGVEGRMTRAPLRVHLTVDLLEADADDGTVSDAKIIYDWTSYARLSAGTGKVPFARGQLESSRSLSSIERALSVIEIAPDHRVGFSIEGTIDRLSYLTGLFNGTEGLADGNEYGGFLTGGRLQYTILGEPKGLGVTDGVAVGASAFYEDAPATNGFAVSGDVLLAMAGAEVTLEALCDRRTPDDAPDISPTLSDEITRCGGYADLAYDLPDMVVPLQPAARVELYDDNRQVDDAGDVWLFSGGVNSNLVDSYLRAQLHYIRRVERHGVGRPNDSVVLSLMGSF
jgi:hypothetical protein